MESVKNFYLNLCTTQSDIYEHLPTLYKYAMECDSIIETGVRGCVSSWALVYGLLSNENAKKRHILLNDIVQCDIDHLLNVTKDLNINIEYQWINNLELNIENTYDLVFIDTWHVYGQLKRELDKFSKITNKYIIMHDTTVDEVLGETIRNNWNALEQSEQTGFPIDEINKGLGPAISEFLETNKDWTLIEKFTNNNGLTILKKIN